MSGQLIVYYDGDEPKQFLNAIFEFPQILPVLSTRSEELKELADKKNRSVLFMKAKEAEVFFSPNFTFHYAGINGREPEDIAVKLKQDFVVMLFFGSTNGEPIALKRKISDETAAPILIYEILKLLRGF